MPNSPTQGKFKFHEIEHGHLELQLLGDWTIGETLPSIDALNNAVAAYPDMQSITVNSSGLGDWDSRLVAFILKLDELPGCRNISLNLTGLPAGAQRLITLARAIPEREGSRKLGNKLSLFASIGTRAQSVLNEAGTILTFIGESGLSFFRYANGRARFRSQDFWLVVQECGPNALPIVTLISLLIGLILAFVGAIQLRMFGADIYIANLVAIGMTREMGAMMTAIIMAGRTGAAFAAQLGTMTVNEEIDAFKTMGIAAMDFLVLPRMLALIVMMPLLTVYADVIGILGGLVVGVGMLDLSLLEYYQQTRTSITLVDCSTGLIKSVVFGILIAGTGCMSGMQCRRSASAVGDATTTAVVRSIVCIVVSDAIFTILFERLGI